MISGTGPDGIIVLKDVDEFRSGPKTTPMAAKLAAENGVDIGALKVDGRVRKADVLAAIKTSVESEELVESNDLPAKRSLLCAVQLRQICSIPGIRRRQLRLHMPLM